MRPKDCLWERENEGTSVILRGAESVRYLAAVHCESRNVPCVIVPWKQPPLQPVNTLIAYFADSHPAPSLQP